MGLLEHGHIVSLIQRHYFKRSVLCKSYRTYFNRSLWL